MWLFRQFTCFMQLPLPIHLLWLLPLCYLPVLPLYCIPLTVVAGISFVSVVFASRHILGLVVALFFAAVWPVFFQVLFAPELLHTAFTQHSLLSFVVGCLLQLKSPSRLWKWLLPTFAALSFCSSTPLLFLSPPNECAPSHLLLVSSLLHQTFLCLACLHLAYAPVTFPTATTHSSLMMSQLSEIPSGPGTLNMASFFSLAHCMRDRQIGTAAADPLSTDRQAIQAISSTNPLNPQPHLPSDLPSDAKTRKSSTSLESKLSGLSWSKLPSAFCRTSPFSSAYAVSEPAEENSTSGLEIFAPFLPLSTSITTALVPKWQELPATVMTLKIVDFGLLVARHTPESTELQAMCNCFVFYAERCISMNDGEVHHFNNEEGLLVAYFAGARGRENSACVAAFRCLEYFRHVATLATRRYTIGLASGVLSVGFIGGHFHSQRVLVGPAMHLARALAHLNEVLETNTLMDERTHQQCQGKVHTILVDVIQGVEPSDAHWRRERVFELLCLAVPGPQALEWMYDFSTAAEAPSAVLTSAFNEFYKGNHTAALKQARAVLRSSHHHLGTPPQSPRHTHSSPPISGEARLCAHAARLVDTLQRQNLSSGKVRSSRIWCDNIWLNDYLPPSAFVQLPSEPHSTMEPSPHKRPAWVLAHWQQDYSTNIAELDRKHQQIFERVGQAGFAIANYDPCCLRRVEEVLDLWLKYQAIQDTEFEQTCFPRTAEHKAAHFELLRLLSSCHECLQRSDYARASQALRSMLVAWQAHFLDEDAYYASWNPITSPFALEAFND
eukprot:NODE_287_length_2488_cov_31.094028_g266_i0.p1 GENE.NODE_287_length_2488_cov_31.094028_g266_i0~~NODE_287_length_2488_cov_31.094028_g266_i0.p1  ORF type:complete len:782 (-),score=171.02 NODE_287_length_2488_cov_31.094028_g266_i0:50-2395(-)